MLNSIEGKLNNVNMKKEFNVASKSVPCAHHNVRVEETKALHEIMVED